MQGTAQSWGKAVEKGENWIKGPAENVAVERCKADESQMTKAGSQQLSRIDMAMEPETMPLKHLLCPECNTQQDTTTMRLKVTTGFSSIKCKNKECGKATLSSQWRCRCRRLWIKCPMHVHETLLGKVSKAKATSRKKGGSTQSARGRDVPMPVKKGDLRCESDES